MDRYESKLEEAEYFFAQMKIKADSRKEFGFYLNAFITSARSVIQYGIKESSSLGKFKIFQEILDRYPIIKNLKDIRDDDIHEKPTTTRAHSSTLVVDIVLLSDNILDGCNDDGGDFLPNKQLNFSGEVNQKTITHHRTDYYFNNMPEQYTVIGYCSGYLDVIRRVLNEAAEGEMISFAKSLDLKK